jgi:hypothetical protein
MMTGWTWKLSKQKVGESRVLTHQNCCDGYPFRPVPALVMRIQVSNMDHLITGSMALQDVWAQISAE